MISYWQSFQSSLPSGGKWSFLLSGVMVLTCVYLYSSAASPSKVEENVAACGPAPSTSAPGDHKKTYPIISKEEVKKHNSMATGVW
jgi:hypothetical protein